MAVRTNDAERPIRRDELYTLNALMRDAGLGTAAMREARRRGLQVHYISARAFILGSDWIDYVLANGKGSKDA